MCWPLLAVFALSALAIEKFGSRLLAMEQRAVAASRKREVGYPELKRAAARRASATGELAGTAGCIWCHKAVVGEAVHPSCRSRCSACPCQH